MDNHIITNKFNGKYGIDMCYNFFVSVSYLKTYTRKNT